MPNKFDKLKAKINEEWGEDTSTDLVKTSFPEISSNNPSSFSSEVPPIVPSIEPTSLQINKEKNELILNQEYINKFLLMKTYGMQRLSFNLSPENIERFNNLAFELKKKHGLKDYHVVNLIFEKFFELFDIN